MSISFPRVGRETAKALVLTLTEAAGLIPYNVFFEASIDEDEDNDG